MKSRGLSPIVIGLSLVFIVPAPSTVRSEPIQFGFLWHMHQPIYYPYESPTATDANNRYSFSVVDVHNGRFGPYTTWPTDAIQAGLGLGHLGAQVSFSGSLIENLNALESTGVNGGMWSNWRSGYNQGAALATTEGNTRLDLVAFGYHHPLMPLLDEQDIRMQIKLHKHVYLQTWGGASSYSLGMFPPETAFSTRIIPALAAEGVEWVLVDNIHFDRACVGYPHTNASCIFSPNPADQVNPDPAAAGGAWVQLNNLWAPSLVSAPFGYQPHHVQHVDPDTGDVTQIIAVPAARYEGNEDGRGGYGAFLFDQVMDAYLAYNTDPAHPMFVMLHHDGDNFGGGSEAYYHSNFQNLIAWVSGDPDYEATTVEDYLDRFPVDAGDVIHVEPGSWAGADCGDPEFKKWLSDPDASGWSPDRNSWAVLTAAKNRVFTAEAAAPVVSLQNVLTGVGSNTERAWHYLLVSEASDYWYWDGSSEPWDSNVTRGCNQAVAFADPVIAGQADTVSPTVFLPQREPYNPGGFEWNPTPESSDFEVWTYVYDISGLTSITLRWRLDADGVNPLASIENETYSGGPEVGAWNGITMDVSPEPPPPANILAPTYRAARYAAMIAGQQDVLIDYYVEALDGAGNMTRTDIQHVYVGDASGGPPGGDAVVVNPDPPVAGEPVTVSYDPAGGPLAGAGPIYLHYGFDNWNPVIAPDSIMSWNALDELWEFTAPVSQSATQLDLVFNDGAGNWDNNGGQDWHFSITGGTPQVTWEVDGSLDADASLVAQNNGIGLYAGVRGSKLYVATNDAGEGNDHFIFVSSPAGAPVAAPWAKAGQVAAWAAFLADENDNDYEGWFDASGSAEAATGPNGGMLEGTIDLAGEFGSVPLIVYLAMGPYATADGGSLTSQSQTPASQNNDGNLDASELIAFTTVKKGDCNGDWRVDVDDVSPFVSILLGTLSDPRLQYAADTDGSTAADGRDVSAFATLLLE